MTELSGISDIRRKKRTFLILIISIPAIFFLIAGSLYLKDKTEQSLLEKKSKTLKNEISFHEDTVNGFKEYEMIIDESKKVLIDKFAGEKVDPFEYWNHKFVTDINEKLKDHPAYQRSPCSIIVTSETDALKDMLGQLNQCSKSLNSVLQLELMVLIRLRGELFKVQAKGFSLRAKPGFKESLVSTKLSTVNALEVDTREPSQNFNQCAVSDIEVGKTNSRQEREYIFIVGSIKNLCSSEIGVQLKATIYDVNDDVVSTKDFWPASTSNIPAGEDFPFEYMMRATENSYSSKIKVISVKKWDVH